MRYTGARVAYYGMLAAAVILFGVGVVLMLGTSGASIWQHRSGLSPDEPTRDGSSMDLSQYGDGSYPIGANTKSPQGILIEPEDGQSWWIETIHGHPRVYIWDGTSLEYTCSCKPEGSHD